MPTTRTRSRAHSSDAQSLLSEHNNHIVALSESPQDNRSGRVIRQLDGSSEEQYSRPTKKQRTAASASRFSRPPRPSRLPMVIQGPGDADALSEDDPSLVGESQGTSNQADLDNSPNVEQDERTPEKSVAIADTVTQMGPEMTTVISNIIDHSERVDQYCAMNAANETSLSSKGLVFVKTGSRMKVESLPILDNLSTQIISTLAKSTYQETIALMNEPDSEAGQEYTTVRSLFEHTKRVYTTKTPFLSPADLDLLEPAQVDVLRKANLATFASGIFGTQEIGFSEMNEHFLEIFVPENGRLLKAQGSLFLELKTQAFIASMNTEDRSKTELLLGLFPDDIERRLLARRPGARNLAPSEQDFVKRVFSRREILLGDINNSAALDALPDRYQWDDFLKDISTYINKKFENLNASTNRIKSRRDSSANGVHPKELQQGQLESNFSVNPAAVTSRPSSSAVGQPSHEDFVAKAARAAQIALQGGLNMPPLGQQAAAMQTQRAFQHTFTNVQILPTFQQYIPQDPTNMSTRSNGASQYGPLPELPHVSQTAPTQVLYERARLAATAKSSPSNRRTGLPSQRRPWTTEEENALMAGLDRVRGPHWSQILAMFGPGGTINESLKDRNQVQLKDKARNLKLFFLKSGIEVPYYLKYVTGDLKTRAPAQASKNEARERERQQGEEDKAHFDGVQGIMALAGAHPQVPDDPNAAGTVDDPAGFSVVGPSTPDRMSLGSNMIKSLDGNIDSGSDTNLDPSLSDTQTVLPLTEPPASAGEVASAMTSE